MGTGGGRASLTRSKSSKAGRHCPAFLLYSRRAARVTDGKARQGTGDGARYWLAAG